MRIFLDMDGVLADFALGCQQVSGVVPPTEWLPDEQFASLRAQMYAGIDACPTFFLDLERLAGATELFKSASEMASELHILTAYPRHYESDSQKIRNTELCKKLWMFKNFGFENFERFHCVNATEKKKFSWFPDDVLVDDTPENISRWTAAGGIGIQFKNANQAIEALKGLAHSKGPM